ncbi:MAG: RNA chaperone Hfq [Clostridia bacterium]|nr:RNA chaperone Hfq [Clostridia bacterium]
MEKDIKNRGINIQDVFLNHVRKTNNPVTIFITNGVQVRGLVKAFDNFIVVLETDGRQQMIYKHAISTISPTRAIDVLFTSNPNED